MKTKLATIESAGHRIVSVDEAGTAIHSVSPYCNPAAIYQLILRTEMAGYTIDWPNSEVSKPE